MSSVCSTASSRSFSVAPAATDLGRFSSSRRTNSDRKRRTTITRFGAARSTASIASLSNERGGSILRSERESDRVGILRGFHDSAHGEEFEVAGRQSLGLEQQVTQILVAAPAIDEHPDVPIHGFYYTHADLGSTVVRDALQVLQ